MSSIDWDYIAALAGDGPMRPEHRERMRREMAIQDRPADPAVRERVSRAVCPGAPTRPANPAHLENADD